MTSYLQTRLNRDGKQGAPTDAEKPSPAPQPPARRDGRPPGNEVTALLWVIVALLAVLEIFLWLFNRIFTV